MDISLSEGSETAKDLVMKFLIEVGTFKLEDKWIEYQSKIELFFKEHTNFDNILRAPLLLAILPPQCHDILEGVSDGQQLDNLSYEFVLKALDNHFYPKKDVAYYRELFQFRKQYQGQSFIHYVRVLRNMMAECNFSKKSKHSKLRNQLIAGVLPEIKSKINQNSMSLSQVFEVGLAFDEEKNRKHSKFLKRQPKCFRCAQALYLHGADPCFFEWSICGGCGVKGHVTSACKYKRKNCDNCDELGHVKKLCKKSHGDVAAAAVEAIKIE
ncbi:uncharacterized protein LOC114336414 [Diabrotica virgifera virgifera]|uniref:Zinc finger CCHC domain-containing protein 4-like n=1 Tax=Diabrotica virgifera virgifera TaxID=50390 RepID=A0ABM5IUN0_DIAVI|nr:uncharacterized protein LOC114336414 [Diabrotica virgifera virgifera]